MNKIEKAKAVIRARMDANARLENLAPQARVAAKQLGLSGKETAQFMRELGAELTARSEDKNRAADLLDTMSPEGQIAAEKVVEILRQFPSDRARSILDEVRRANGIDKDHIERIIQGEISKAEKEIPELEEKLDELKAEKAELEVEHRQTLARLNGSPQTLRFREFIEDAAKNGVWDPAAGQISMPDYFFEETVVNARVFVFQQSRVKKLTDEEIVAASEESLELYLPFKICWFECALSVSPEGQVFERMIAPISMNEKDSNQRIVAKCIGLLVEETSPGQFNYWIYFERNENKVRVGNIIHYSEMLDHIEVLGSDGPLMSTGGKHYVTDGQQQFRKMARAVLMPLLEQFLESATGTVAVNDKFKIKNTRTGAKLFPKIRRIVHVVPKRLRGKEIPGESRQVDWSHRWLVRGHWMTFWKDKLNGIVDKSRLGKNREGDYCVYGYTWRDEFVKGPEGKVLIANKTRLVKSD